MKFAQEFWQRLCHSKISPKQERSQDFIEQLKANPASDPGTLDTPELPLPSFEKISFRTSDLFLEFEIPTFPDKDLDLPTDSLEGFDLRMFEEKFDKEQPNFESIKFADLNFDPLLRDDEK